MEKMYEMLAEDAGAGSGSSMSAAGSGAAYTGESPAAPDPDQAKGGASERIPFDDLIKGEYKKDYEAKIQENIGQRFRSQENYKKQLEAYAPIMQALGEKYGRDPKDVEGIGKLLTDDDSLYEEEANRRGIPVGTLKQMKKLQAENSRLQEQQRESLEEMSMRQHFQRISQQAEELKATFPDFDLMQEMSNPRFARLTSPGVGISVRDAYYAIHGEEIQQKSMQYAAQQAGQRIAASVRSGAGRPIENGAMQPGPANIQVDVKRMSKEQREEYRKRIHNGETGIDFKNKF